LRQAFDETVEGVLASGVALVCPSPSATVEYDGSIVSILNQI
jgi:hypothetical protein